MQPLCSPKGLGDYLTWPILTTFEVDSRNPVIFPDEHSMMMQHSRAGSPFASCVDLQCGEIATAVAADVELSRKWIATSLGISKQDKPDPPIVYSCSSSPSTILSLPAHILWFPDLSASLPSCLTVT